jgi:hypothetical protein
MILKQCHGFTDLRLSCTVRTLRLMKWECNKKKIENEINERGEGGEQEE